MRIQISLSAFPYDVDHMQGTRRIKDEEVYTVYSAWKKHADAVNTKYHDDNAEIASSSKSILYAADDTVFAYWDKHKKIGTVCLTGKRLESFR